MIRIGDLTLPDETVAVHERRDTDPDLPARTIRITGSVGDAPVAELEDRLDAVVRAATAGGGEVELGLRPGRRIVARLLRLDREVHRAGREAVFTAVFTSDQVFEEADTETETSWTIQAWGAALPVHHPGTVACPLHIRFSASGAVVAPAFDDGVRRISYGGAMTSGQTLVIDGVAGKATLNGADITAQMTGAFPQLDPGANTLRFFDDFDSAHQGTATLRWRARWW